MGGETASVIRGVKTCRTPAGEFVTISLGGDIDLHHSPAVRNELIRLSGDRPARLIVDLSAVDYMDSSGVATLVQALQQVKRYSGRLVLVAPNDRVLSIFQIARLDSIFQIVATHAEAVAQ